MMKPQVDLIKQIEQMLLARLDLLKLYPVLSAQAMQLLEESDAEGFLQKLTERGALIEKADALTGSIDALASGLDGSFGAAVSNLIKPGAASGGCPEWGVHAARIMERTQKLIRSCALFDKKLMASARAVSEQMQEQHGRTLMQRKINSLYTVKSADPHGAHIQFSSK